MPKDYVCEFCSHVSHSSNNAKAHRATHTGELPFTCHVCALGFQNGSARNQHVRSCHPGAPPAPRGPKPKTYQATVAAKVNTDPDGHVTAPDGTVLVIKEAGDSRFGCPECGAKLSSRSCVREHLFTEHDWVHIGTCSEPCLCRVCTSARGASGRLWYSEAKKNAHLRGVGLALPTMPARAAAVVDLTVDIDADDAVKAHIQDEVDDDGGLQAGAGAGAAAGAGKPYFHVRRGKEQACTDCGVVCSSKIKLVEHRHDVHGVPYPYECGTCHFWTAHQSLFSKHACTGDKVLLRRQPALSLSAEVPPAADACAPPPCKKVKAATAGVTAKASNKFLVGPDGAEVVVEAVEGVEPPRYTCPFSGCGQTRASRVLVCMHLVDDHRWQHLCVPPQSRTCSEACCKGRVFYNEAHYKAGHQRKLPLPAAGVAAVPQMQVVVLERMLALRSNVVAQLMQDIKGIVRATCPEPGCGKTFVPECGVVGQHVLRAHPTPENEGKLAGAWCVKPGCRCGNAAYWGPASLKSAHPGEPALRARYRCWRLGCSCGNADLFDDLDEYNAHIGRHEGEYQCAKPGCACGGVFATKDAWLRHTGVATFCCEHCGASFVTPGDLTKHFEACVVVNAGRTWPCPVQDCAYVGESQSAQKQHIRRMHGVHDTVHTCDFCEYTHYLQSEVRKHMQRHSKERPFQCCECPQAFKTDGDLHDHMHLHRDEWFACTEPECKSAPFKTKKQLATHVRHTHGELRFFCSVCDAGFRTRAHRDSHLDTHSDVRKHVCPTCFMPFRQLSVLRNHITYQHTKSRPHPCAECGLVFPSPWELATHAVVHTDGYTYGRSDKERQLFQALIDSTLPFSTEVRLPGLQGLPFDFAVFKAPVDKDKALVWRLLEYDGVHHFRPYGTKPHHVLALLRRVQNDLTKTRHARAAGIRLIRMNGHIRADVLRRLEGAALPYDDYVYPKAYTSALATHARSFAGNTAAMTVDDALGALMRASPTLCDLGDEDCTGLLDAVVTMFAREVAAAASSLDETVHKFGADAVEAFLHLAQYVPEFVSTQPVRVVGCIGLDTRIAHGSTG